MSQIEVIVAEIHVTGAGFVRSVLPKGFCEKENIDGTFTIYTGEIAEFGLLVGEMGFTVKNGVEVLYFDPVDSQYEDVFKEALKEKVQKFDEVVDDDLGPAIG